MLTLLHYSRLPVLFFTTLILHGCANYQDALQNYDDRVPENEIRALWVVRTEIKTRDSITAVIDAMKANGLNVAIVQVRGRGDAYYHSALVSPAHGIEEGLDPLAEFIRQARKADIEVHAWINVFLAADASTFLENHSRHLINTRKDWFLRDAKNRSMLDYGRRDYKLANVEGAFLDPANAEVRAYNLKIVRELLDHYEVDGLHLDYIRYPWSRSNTDYNFGVNSALQFADQNHRAIEEARLNEIRRNNVSSMVREIRKLARERYPGLILSAAVWPSQSKIQNHIFQDFPRWLKEDWIDYAYLMAYYDKIELHDSRMEEFFDPTINKRLVIGIGVFRSPSPRVTGHQLRSARAIQAAGVCYFDASWFLDSRRKDEIVAHRLWELFSERTTPPPLR